MVVTIQPRPSQGKGREGSSAPDRRRDLRGAPAALRDDAVPACWSFLPPHAQPQTQRSELKHCRLGRGWQAGWPAAQAFRGMPRVTQASGRRLRADAWRTISSLIEEDLTFS